MARKTAASTIVAGFASRLRLTRELYGQRVGNPLLSQKEFAAAVGIEAETYRRYERGETEPPLATLARIRAVTGVSLDFLVAGSVPTAA